MLPVVIEILIRWLLLCCLRRKRKVACVKL